MTLKLASTPIHYLWIRLTTGLLYTCFKYLIRRPDWLGPHTVSGTSLSVFLPSLINWQNNEDSYQQEKYTNRKNTMPPIDNWTQDLCQVFMSHKHVLNGPISGRVKNLLSGLEKKIARKCQIWTIYKENFFMPFIPISLSQEYFKRIGNPPYMGGFCDLSCKYIIPTLQMKGWWECNINIWFPFMYSQKWNCYFQNRIIMICLPIPSFIYCERYIYFQNWSAYSAAGKYVDRSWEYINRSQTHECGNWDWGRAIPRKGIHKWDFPCSAYVNVVYFLYFWYFILHTAKTQCRKF